MKVILLKDVAKIGKRFEVRDVPSGYALNFLIPRKLAESATGEALKRLQTEKQTKTIVNTHAEASFNEALASLKASTLVLEKKANEQGHLFEGVHVRDVWNAIMSRGLTMREDDIQIPSSIKTVGDHTIVCAHGNMSEKVTIRIAKVV